MEASSKAGLALRLKAGSRGSACAHVLLHDRQQLGEDLGRAGDQTAALEEPAATGEVGDEATGLEDQQRAGRHVPAVQAGFPEAVETAAGDVGEVQRGGAGTAQAGGLLRQLAEGLDVGLDVVDLAERKA